MYPLGAVVLFLAMVIQCYNSLSTKPIYHFERPPTANNRDGVPLEKEDNFTKFIVDKLIEQGEALEHLTKIEKENEEVLKVLVNNLDRNMKEPKLPEKLVTRRSKNGDFVPEALIPTDGSVNKISPWCKVALRCRDTNQNVCGFDQIFGYGKFDDLCHLLQVNCYWRYNFALVKCETSNIIY